MTLRRLAPLAALMLAGGLVLGQPPAKKDTPVPKEPPKPAPGSLEDTLEKSLRNSADIKAGEAKVREAEAELNKVRHQVLTRATALHSDLTLAKRMLNVAEQTLARQNELVKTGTVGLETLLASQTMVEKHRGEVEKLQAELKSLRGEFAVRSYVTNMAFSPDGGSILLGGLDGKVRVWDAATGQALTGWTHDGKVIWDYDRPTAKAPTVQSTMADRIRKFLETEVSYQEVLKGASGEVPLSQMMEALLKAAKADVPIHKAPAARDARCIIDQDATGKMPVGAILQLFEDEAKDVRIVVREYGLLLTTKDRMPDGAVRVIDFWKAKDTKKEEPKAAKN